MLFYIGYFIDFGAEKNVFDNDDPAHPHIK
jgi:hypothetical protein